MSFNRDQLQALRHLDYYPQIPAVWPNRAVRRAAKANRPDRLPNEWRPIPMTNPALWAAVKGL